MDESSPLDPALVDTLCSYDAKSGWTRDPQFDLVRFACPKCASRLMLSKEPNQSMVVEHNQSNDHRIICLHCGHIKREF